MSRRRASAARAWRSTSAHAPPLALALGIALFAGDAPAAVFRCVEPDTPVGFTQFGCPPRALREAVDPEPLSAIAELELSDAERKALVALEARLERDRSAARSRQEARSREAARTRAESARLCEAARAALDRLARQRRGGYTVAEARGLDEAADRWQAQSRAHC